LTGKTTRELSLFPNIAAERPATLSFEPPPKRQWMKVSLPADEAFVLLVESELAEARRRALELLEPDSRTEGKRGDE
jgi:hypothetical protein